MKPTKGRFITFEGCEGSGKSTQARMLSEYFAESNIAVDLTREIGGTISAESMREILVHQDLLPMSELLQIMAARYEHMHKRIIPKLNSGISVICDRFLDSTACYQGQEIDMDLIYRLHNNLISEIVPDITFFIDLDPSIALSRALLRGGANKFEAKDLKFHEKVYNGFVSLSKKFPARIKRINVKDHTEEEVHNIIRAHL